MRRSALECSSTPSLKSTARPSSLVTAPNAQLMQCMEVWGGNQLTSRAVEFGGLNVWVYSKPYGQAEHGGDGYYASGCAPGRISRLLLADVSGHGNSVAATAADLRTLMRRFVNRLDQTEFVRLLNQQFTALSREGTFATAIVATFFAPSRRLTVCNAGHPRPLLYRAAQRQWNYLGHEGPGVQSTPSNIPLGLLEMPEYESLTPSWRPELACLVTPMNWSSATTRAARCWVSRACCGSLALSGRWIRRH